MTFSDEIGVSLTRLGKRPPSGLNPVTVFMPTDENAASE